MGDPSPSPSPRRVEEGFGHTPLIHEKKEPNIDAASAATQVHRVDSNEIPEEQKDEQPLIKPKTKRIATLDVFRGLTVVVRIWDIYFQH